MVTLRYSYTNKDNKPMMFLCQVHNPPHMTIGTINQHIQDRLENEVGPITDLKLLAQNDPEDILMVTSMGETK